MNPRTLYHACMTVLGLLLLAIIGVGIVSAFDIAVAPQPLGATWLVLVLLALWYGLWRLVTRAFHCPHCGKRVSLNPIHHDWFKVMLTTPWAPRHCSRCNHDFDRAR